MPTKDISLCLPCWCTWWAWSPLFHLKLIYDMAVFVLYTRTDLVRSLSPRSPLPNLFSRPWGSWGRDVMGLQSHIFSSYTIRASRLQNTTQVSNLGNRNIVSWQKHVHECWVVLAICNMRQLPVYIHVRSLPGYNWGNSNPALVHVHRYSHAL